MTSETRDIFQHATPVAELRHLLRASGRCPAAKLARMSDDEVTSFALSAQTDHDQAEMARQGVQGAVDAGRLSQSEADRMSDKELIEYDLQLTLAGDLRKEISGKDALAPRAGFFSSARAKAPVTAEHVTRSELVAMMSDFVAVLAGMQTEIDALREELARERNAKLALFGKQEVIKQLVDAERDVKAFEAIIELEEEASESIAEEQENASSTSKSVTNVRDTRAGIQVLAQNVAGLDAGRKVDVAEMNKAVTMMKESSKRRAKVRSRGRVEIKIGELSGAKPKG